MTKQHKCPICGKETTDEKYRPFCSTHCADVDLGRWFNGSYAVASEDLDELEVEELGEALENAQQTKQ